MATRTVVHRASVPGSLRALRVVTAVLAAAMAVVYLLIGLGVLHVVEVGPNDPSLLWFGLPAAVAFGFGAVVMVVSERRLLWALGAAFQVFTILAYLDVAETRTPPFEAWGIGLRVAQAMVLVALAALLVRYPRPVRVASAGRGHGRFGARRG